MKNHFKKGEKMGTNVSETNMIEEGVSNTIDPKFRIYKILLFTFLLFGPLAYIIFVAFILFIKAK